MNDGLQVQTTDVVAIARALARDRAVEVGREDLADDVTLVASELVTNALLHGGGCRGIDVLAVEEGLRLEVHDHNPVPPVLGHPSHDSLTGRGMRVVTALASQWGAEVEKDGKVVWAVLTGQAPTNTDVSEEDLLAMWGEEWAGDGDEITYHVELGEVPTDLLLAAKGHVDNVVREIALAAAGAEAGTTAELPPHLASLLTAVESFSEARRAVKHQALDAARREADVTRLVFDLPARAVEAAGEYLAALDEIDAYCRAMRMLTLETPPQHRVFRQWYVGELVKQLGTRAAGETPPPPQSFERRLLAELDRLAAAQRASARAARLYSVAAALASADSPAAVASAVLNEGVAALRASGGGVLLATDMDRLALPGAVGYDDAVVARLRSESRDAELPAAVALRTGEPVWLESRDERDRRFPDLADLEADTVAMCAVPLEVQGRRLGALRFSFTEPRLFDEDERRFVLALAAQAAQALERTKLQQARVDVSRRLQRSLLPPDLPAIPGIEVAAIYHPFGDAVDVGGDFYDVWPIGEGCWGVAIGDAAGTGPEAAALTAMVRHTLRALAMSDSDPERVMTRLNTSLWEAAPADDDRFCTAVYGIVRPGEQAELLLAGAGHPPLVVRRANGDLEEHLLGGTLLGVFQEATIGTLRLLLAPGDTIVLMTDGVLEARRAGVQFEMEGVERVMAAAVPTAHATVIALEKAVLEHTDGSLTDDVAAVALRVRER